MAFGLNYFLVLVQLKAIVVGGYDSSVTNSSVLRWFVRRLQQLFWAQDSKLQNRRRSLPQPRIHQPVSMRWTSQSLENKIYSKRRHILWIPQIYERAESLCRTRFSTIKYVCSADEIFILSKIGCLYVVCSIERKRLAELMAVKIFTISPYDPGCVPVIWFTSTMWPRSTVRRGAEEKSCLFWP